MSGRRLAPTLAAALAATLLPVTVAAQEGAWDITVPRGTPRIISFTTDEGTWMSVDVSPDGSTIAMDLLGEIWLVPIGGGLAHAITRDSGMALNFHPMFSPDGTRIAFISDRDGQDNLWVADTDGSNMHPVSTQRDDRMALPVWMPDGEYLVARVGGDSNINGRGTLWMWHVDGGAGIRLTGEDVNASWPAPSPDGRYLYYEERVAQGFGDPNPANAIYQIRRLDRVSGRVLEITSGIGPVRDGGGGRRSSGGANSPAISPDGRWMAFARRIADGTQMVKGHEYGPRTALWLRDLRDGSERTVMDPITPDIAERNNAGALPRHAWHPDGRSIVLTEGGKLKRLWVEDGRIDEIPFTAQVERTISEQVYHPFAVETGPVDVKLMRWHTASPDGRTLAFVALDRIWLMDVPGGPPRPLSDAGYEQYSPAWAPDGRTLAFTSWSDAEGGALWTVPAGGGRPTRLTTLNGMYLNPTWSPDGSSIVFVRGSGEMLRGRLASDEAWFYLESLPARGGEVRQLGEVSGGRRGHVPAPRFGPEGRIFFMESGALKSVDAAGGDARTHVRIQAGDEAAPSPDGRWLAFSRGSNLYLTPMTWPGAQGDPVEITTSSPPLPVTRLTLEGGNFPTWAAPGVLEWGSADRYFRRDVRTGSTDTLTIRLQVPRSLAQGEVALTGARLVTMNGDEVIERGDLIVRDGRIAAIGPSGSVTIPAGVRRIDVAGTTIIPGMIDTHKHATREANGVLSQNSWELAANLAFGVTTALEPSGGGEAVFPMAESVEAGVRTGTRMYSTGPAISEATQSPEDAEHVVNRVVSYGARSIKQYWQPRRDQRQWVVEAARKAGVMVTSEGDTDHLSALALAMDGHTGTEHPIYQLPLYADVARFLGQANFFYSATLVVGGAGPWGEDYFYQESNVWENEKLQRFVPWRWLFPHTRRRPLRPVTDYPFPIHAQGAADVIAAGGHASIGAHGQLQGIDSHFELWMYGSAMPPMEALRTATTHPAQMIGILDDVGTLEVGKLGDLVVLRRNPLEDLRATTDIRYVMKAGILYDGDTLDEVWPTARPFGGFFWSTTLPPKPERDRSDEIRDAPPVASPASVPGTGPGALRARHAHRPDRFRVVRHPRGEPPLPGVHAPLVWGHDGHAAALPGALPLGRRRPLPFGERADPDPGDRGERHLRGARDDRRRDPQHGPDAGSHADPCGGGL